MNKKKRRQIRRWHKVIVESGRFDEGFYLEHNPDVQRSGIDPIEHYLLYGAKEGRDPNDWFDSDFYLSAYPDVVKSGINPFVHYLLYGEKEGRHFRSTVKADSAEELETTEAKEEDTTSGRVWSREEKDSYRIIGESGFFDEKWYFDTYDAARSDLRGALEYYIEIGQYRGDNPVEWFDAAYYLETYPDVKERGGNPFVHYILHGQDEGRLPRAPKESETGGKTRFGRKWTEEEKESYRVIKESGFFDEGWYLDACEEARQDPRGALEHYIEVGQYRGCNPVEWFDASYYYFKNYSDLKKSGLNPFSHYILWGKEAGHLPKASEAQAEDEKNVDDESIGLSASIKGFDEKAYLAANPDVAAAVERGYFKSAAEHLELYGLSEIEKGVRKYHPNLDYYSDANYYENFVDLVPEAKEDIESGKYVSVFEHFCKVGYPMLLRYDAYISKIIDI